MADAKHTPLPWRRDKTGGSRGDVRGANGRWVAACWGLAARCETNHRPSYRAECAANAELIVRAVNCHDELVAALVAIEGALPELRQDGTERVVDPGSPRGLVRAAIAKAMEGR